ncbi:mandelate racemase/muconate lactonizing enzyme family protein [Naasia sp. SYSU D00948]|uniref:mandelate racemase/muconate lactonizing enzyme family protein n=1 Tax=Naasia sp. SYSU D00948 TaxID=2817379 RepID=UPI001B31587F|nr:mandelate racemase/muconate lactonizing enzyme family protein [Naasia sp. SYSU D00948]
MTATIRELRTRRIRIPLTRPWGADVRDLSVVEVAVTASDGAEGHGFSWTPTIGGRAVQALLEDDIAPFAAGLPAEPSIWRDVWERIHEAGGGGVTTIALAGLDLALWDLAGRRAHRSVTDLLGRRHDRQPVYGSGVNLHYSQEQLVEQVRRWVAAGYGAVKVKIGKPDLAEDLDRLQAVREVLGHGRALMVDANQRWELDRATRAAEALLELGVRWLEEPMRADDLAAHRELKRRVPLPLAVGENLHTVHRFRDWLDAGAADVVQPNVIRVGGITPFLAIAELARERGVELAPHLLPELSAQLAFALPESTWVEDVEDAGFEQLGSLVEAPGLRIEKGWVTGGPPEGLGIRFAEEEKA